MALWNTNRCDDPMVEAEFIAETVSAEAQDVGLEDNLEYFVRFFANSWTRDLAAQVEALAPGYLFS